MLFLYTFVVLWLKILLCVRGLAVVHNSYNISEIHKIKFLFEDVMVRYYESARNNNKVRPDSEGSYHLFKYIENMISGNTF